ncbi:MAG: PilN domain-containing protein, partial [Bacillota bacterium]
YLLASTRMLESERERVAAQRLQLERQMAASRHWEKKLDEVYRLRALLLQAMGRPADWSALLAGLGRSVPEGVCVTALRCEQASGSPTGEPKTPSTGGKTVIVTGYAVSHREVAALLDALQAAANLREVRCQYSTAEEINERRLTKYEIRVVLPPATPYRPPLEGGEVR